MASEPQANNNNGDDTEQQQAINVLAQYVKDFSFENPNAPNSLGPQENPPQIALQVNVNGRPLAGDDFEVELTIEGGAGEGAGKLFHGGCFVFFCHRRHH